MQTYDDSSNDELAEQLKAQLMGGSRKTAFDLCPAPAADAVTTCDNTAATNDIAAATNDDTAENPLGDDFFQAMNAFRSARSGGDPATIAAAEAALQAVVRQELIDSNW